MDAPRHYATLGRFIAFVSDLDEELRIFAVEPWAAGSMAVATTGTPHAGMPREEAAASAHEHIAAAFGERPREATERDEPAWTFFFEVDELQQIVRRLRRAGVRDHAQLCEQVIARARDR